MRSVDEKTALGLIRELRAIVKVISYLPEDKGKHLSFTLDQLAAPNKVRPYSPPIRARDDGVAPEEVDRSYIRDTRTGKLSRRQLPKRRGLPKPDDYLFTKKTSTTLLQPDGKTKLFGSSKVKIGLLFDLEKIKLKLNDDGDEKYVWEKHVFTNARGWLGEDESIYFLESISLKELKEILTSAAKQGKSLDYNEILACLSKDALKAVFSAEDNRVSRLNALRAKEKIKRTLGIDLPILIITTTNEPKIYDTEAQLRDINAALENPDEDLPETEMKILNELEIVINQKVIHKCFNELLISKFSPEKSLSKKTLQEKIGKIPGHYLFEKQDAYMERIIEKFVFKFYPNNNLSNIFRLLKLIREAYPDLPTDPAKKVAAHFLGALVQKLMIQLVNSPNCHKDHIRALRDKYASYLMFRNANNENFIDILIKSGKEEYIQILQEKPVPKEIKGGSQKDKISHQSFLLTFGNSGKKEDQLKRVEGRSSSGLTV